MPGLPHIRIFSGTKVDRAVRDTANRFCVNPRPADRVQTEKRHKESHDRSEKEKRQRQNQIRAMTLEMFKAEKACLPRYT